MNNGKPSGWKRLLLKAAIASTILILGNLVVVYFMGSAIWLYAGYFFGNNVRTTLTTLLFVEGGVILALGAVWVSAAMESRFDGSNIATNPYRRQEQWKQRSDELKQENIAGKIMILVGAPMLVVAIVLIFV